MQRRFEKKSDKFLETLLAVITDPICQSSKVILKKKQKEKKYAENFSRARGNRL